MCQAIPGIARTGRLSSTSQIFLCNRLRKRRKLDLWPLKNMEGASSSDRVQWRTANMDEKALAKMKGKFNQVDVMLDHNRMLINEINRNHEEQIPEGLTKNVSLIGELNQNIKTVVDFHVQISDSFVKFFPFAGNNQEVGDENGQEEEQGDEEEQEEEEGSTAGGEGGSGQQAESGSSSDSFKRKRA